MDTVLFTCEFYVSETKHATNLGSTGICAVNEDTAGPSTWKRRFLKRLFDPQSCRTSTGIVSETTSPVEQLVQMHI